jgi:hypothetical protein
VLLGWDGAGNQVFSIEVADYGAAQVAFSPTRSWLFLPRHTVLFEATATQPVPELPTAMAPLWPMIRGQIVVGVAAAAVAPLPLETTLERTPAGTILVVAGSGRWQLELDPANAGGKPTLQVRRPAEGSLVIDRWEQTDAAELARLVPPPADPGRREAVSDADLRAMATTLVDLLCEKALVAISPRLLPSYFGNDVRREEGKAVAVLKGTPAEIGHQYGTQLRQAVVANVHRVLHGVGLIKTIQSGKWLPGELAAAWKRQEPFIPRHYIEEIDAMADAAGVPREWARSTNVFPELFHCSGIALRGAATQDGRLLHGRILDYMTELGLQYNAVITVVAPQGRRAWVNIGYAGCLGTVSAMNVDGLAFGEMGGRGEGYLDGIPMTFMMREVVERFDDVREAVAWIRSVPRTCEYFYVLSAAKTRDMVGLASYARALAAERQIEDLQVVEPGAAHPLLPRPLADAVLLSGGDRYNRLVDRVQQEYGKITAQEAWKIMGKGVAMRSALHIVLFQPETLDFWLADAGPRAQPAYTQQVARLNLRQLLDGQPPAAPTAARP